MTNILYKHKHSSPLSTNDNLLKDKESHYWKLICHQNNDNYYIFNNYYHQFTQCDMTSCIIYVIKHII
jgi:hypothetical protein